MIPRARCQEGVLWVWPHASCGPVLEWPAPESSVRILHTSRVTESGLTSSAPPIPVALCEFEMTKGTSSTPLARSRTWRISGGLRRPKPLATGSVSFKTKAKRRQTYASFRLPFGCFFKNALQLLLACTTAGERVGPARVDGNSLVVLRVRPPNDIRILSRGPERKSRMGARTLSAMGTSGERQRGGHQYAASGGDGRRGDAPFPVAFLNRPVAANATRSISPPGHFISAGTARRKDAPRMPSDA